MKSVRLLLLLFLIASCGEKPKVVDLEYDVDKDKDKKEVFVCISSKSMKYHFRPDCNGFGNCTEIMLSTVERAKANGYEILCEFEVKK
jgi:hypothetical protein